jgi:two-component system, OmpR family, sensor kinase
MKPGRLHLTVVLGALVVLFSIGGMWIAIRIVRPGHAELDVWSQHVIGDLSRWRNDPNKLREQLDELTTVRFDASVYDANGALIASNVTPSLISDDDNFVRDVVEDGRVVMHAVGYVHHPAHAAIIALSVILLSLGVLVLIIVRHVGTPLQRLANAARRFGAGDLTARANIRRSDELGEVGRAFDQMAERITTLMTAQRELMANVSHEFQTPLARIQVAVDLMSDGMDVQVKELLPEIGQDLKELERLIDDVMTLSRFSLADTPTMPLHREDVQINDLVTRSAMRFKTQHSERELSVELVDDVKLSVDQTLLRRAIDNLLDNAHKYSEADRAIELTATRRDTRIEIVVKDHGIGIEGGDLPKLFTPFFRTDRSRSRKTGGVGLGLVLARRIAEAHDGKIHVISEVGVGTSVTLELPLQA